MTSAFIYLSILSCTLLNLFITSTAQTGEGCTIRSACLNKGQVRINAIYDQLNNWIGGCNCGCDPTIICPQPQVINFDPITQTGDCSCITPTVQIPNTNPNPNPNQNPNPSTPSIPSQWIYPGLPVGIVPGPHIPDYGVAAAAAEVICGVPATTNGVPQPCEGPVGHKGDLTIICDGPEACVEQEINCNNDGFSCTVNCISNTACEGATVINGPKHGSLTVNCMGEFSCEGGTTFNGNEGTDLYVHCDGPAACIEGIFNMGSGRSIIACNEVESCALAAFNLYPNAVKTAGVQFSCMGSFCPIDAPTPFSNIFGTVTQTCTKAGNCACHPGTNGECNIICEGSQDACKDGVIDCNNGGHACTVNCIGEQSCAGSTVINGPTDSALTVYCKGAKACEGSVTFNGKSSTDMTVICDGRESCKGAPVYNFGTAVSKLECNGEPDTCAGTATFNLLQNAKNTPGMGFSCTGMLCPANVPDAFNNVQVPPPVQIPNGPIIVNPQPQPPVPQNPQPQTPQTTSQPQMPQPQPQQTSQAQLPPLPNIPPAHCCVLSDPQMTLYQGRCWYYTNEIGCHTEQGRCEWNRNKCLATAPTCKMPYVECTINDECCSNYCYASPGAAAGSCY